MSFAVVDDTTISNFVSDEDKFEACVGKYLETFDLDGDGALSEQELLTCLQEMGAWEEESGIEAILEKFDEDRDGKLAPVEFLTLVKEVLFAIARGIGSCPVLMVLQNDSLLMKAVEYENSVGC